jgi:hypothetical protein
MRPDGVLELRRRRPGIDEEHPQATGPLRYDDSVEIVATGNEKTYSPETKASRRKIKLRNAKTTIKRLKAIRQFEKDVGIAERRKSEDQRKRREKHRDREARRIASIFGELYDHLEVVDKKELDNPGVYYDTTGKIVKRTRLTYPSKKISTYLDYLNVNKYKIKKIYEEMYGKIERHEFGKILAYSAAVSDKQSAHVKFLVEESLAQKFDKIFLLDKYILVPRPEPLNIKSIAIMYRPDQ